MNLQYSFAFDWMVLTQDLKAIQIITQRKGQGSTTKQLSSLDVGEQKLLAKTPI